MELLRTELLCKVYSRRTVVNNVSFHVNAGEIVGLLGPNGAGKTTAFRMTIGMIRPDGGRVIFDGQDVTPLPMYRRARLGMGYLSQEPSVFQRLTVRENIMAILETQRLPQSERQARLDGFVRRMKLQKVLDAPAYALSGGERRRLEISRCLAISPRLILLDEPFSGVDPIAVGEIQAIILGLVRSGIGVLLTDHNVHDTLSVTHRSYILNDGKIEAFGTAAELLNNPRARQFYLGDRLQIEHVVPPQAAESEIDEGPIADGDDDGRGGGGNGADAPGETKA